MEPAGPPPSAAAVSGSVPTATATATAPVAAGTAAVVPAGGAAHGVGQGAVSLGEFGSAGDSAGTASLKRHYEEDDAGFTLDEAQSIEDQEKERRQKKPKIEAPPILDKARERIIKSFARHLKTDALASATEDAIYNQSQASGANYKALVRTKLQQVMPGRNATLRKQLLSGAISPQQFASMTAEEMQTKSSKVAAITIRKKCVKTEQIGEDSRLMHDYLVCPSCKSDQIVIESTQDEDGGGSQSPSPAPSAPGAAAVKRAPGAAATAPATGAGTPAATKPDGGGAREAGTEKQQIKCETCNYTWQSSASDVDCVPIVHF